MSEEARPSKNDQNPGPTDETLKDTFQSIIIAFVLAFTFRAYVVEAFVIPTGSMAPTLLGAHFPMTCEQCGYQWEVDAGLKDMPTSVVPCPMCHFNNDLNLPRRPSAGDRILVQKYPYYFGASQPRRWDVVVFKAPHVPDENYIKRLTGLPGEAIHISNGNIFVTPIARSGTRADGRPQYEFDRTGQNWRIARKTDPAENPHWETIQRTVWQPVYHSQFLPSDGGVVKINDSEQVRWRLPWIAEEPEYWRGLGGRLENGQHDLARSYIYMGKENSGWGTIKFDWARAFGIRESDEWIAGDDGVATAYAYNYLRDLAYPSQMQYWQYFDEIRIAANVIPQIDKVDVELATQALIYHQDEFTSLSAKITSTGDVILTWTDAEGDETTTTGKHNVAFERGKAVNVELWYVDMELSCWIDGEQVAVHRFEISDDDVPWESMKGRTDQREDSFTKPVQTRLPSPAIRISGPAILKHVELDRDLHYTTFSDNSFRAVTEPFVIEPDQFFCMGDNSPSSLDSRGWRDLAPWIEEGKFTEDGPPAQGVVPRRLMMGRAFFVYFPAPYALGDQTPRFLPNFGKMRFIH